MDMFDGVSPRLGQNSDDEEGLSTPSNYSSCGSELERYCSANSVLGTASSVCSSVGNHSELLDNFRSLDLGEDLEIFCGREKLGCRSFGRNRNPVDSGRLDWLSDGTVDSPTENGPQESPIFGRRAVALQSRRLRMGFDHIMGINENNCGDNIGVKIEGRKTSATLPENNGNFEDGIDAKNDAGSSISHVSARQDHAGCTGSPDVCIRGSTSECCAQNGSVGLDDDVIARREYSDCEDSVLDSGTDDEDRIHLIQRKALQKFKNAKINIYGNPLLMNAAVAFGENDWDDIMQETEEVGLLSTPPFGLENSEQTQKQLNSEKICLDSYVQEGLGKTDIRENGHLDDAGDMSSSCISYHQVYEKNEAARSYPIGDPLEVDIPKGIVHKTFANLQTNDYLDATKSNQNLRDDIHDNKEQMAYNGKITVFHCQNTRDAMLVGESQLSPVDFTSNIAPEVVEIQVKNKETSKASVSLMIGNGHGSDISNKDIASEKANGPDAKELFEEMVLDMEDILLDSGDSRRGRYAQALYMSQHFHYRDGSSTASTSDTNDTHALYQHPFRIEGVEVVGAKQKKGDVSFGERLVGVKEYTVYRLRVWSGKDQWEVEHRYREFFSLYRQLKSLFKDHGLILPSPWSKVERESRNFFGNVSPNVVNERSSIIQDCLHSILNAKTPFGTPSSLVLFLSPSKDNDSSLSSNLLPQSLQRSADDVNSNSSNCSNFYSEEVATLGKKISLVVELKVHKSTRQLLEEQQYMCAGCHKYLFPGKSLMQEFVKTMGWGKPRLCEYTGQLFCSSCQTTDTAVLPARVLHNWDFSLYPISQLAKAYLDSIYDKPMLCVSAVNPFLFSKVPALHHIMGIRRKIGAMVPYIRCPFRRSIQRGLGSRRYLLESNDFFALRDLVDLSKGPFSALPMIVEAASSKILEHITQKCLICYDIGAPCAAKQACRDPASAILPFQELEAVRCSLCSAIFHEACIQYLGGCQCSKPAKTAMDERTMPSKSSAHKDPTELNSLTLQKTDRGAPPTGFLFDLLSKATPEKLWKRKNSSPVILMGSLPSTSF